MTSATPGAAIGAPGVSGVRHRVAQVARQQLAMWSSTMPVACINA